MDTRTQSLDWGFLTKSPNANQRHNMFFTDVHYLNQISKRGRNAPNDNYMADGMEQISHAGLRWLWISEKIRISHHQQPNGRYSLQKLNPGKIMLQKELDLSREVHMEAHC